jgi:hypothetical protein
MKELTVERNAEGDLDIRNMPAALVYALRELPKLLSEEFPESTSRIEQAPYGGGNEDGNEENSADWERHGHPELRHLFESARDLVIEDLQSLKREGLLPPLYRIRIPGTNVTAWLSAIAAARVGLGEVHEVTPEDLEHVRGALFTKERDRGILIIQILGWMQAILIG